MKPNGCANKKRAASIMQVTRFVNPEWRIEIEVDAVVSGT